MTLCERLARLIENASYRGRLAVIVPANILTIDLARDAGSPQWVTKWEHPRTKKTFTLRVLSSGNLSDRDLNACFELIAETSESDYRNSSVGWHPDKKLKEMKSAELRYILVKDGDGDGDGDGDSDSGGSVRAFTSMMPTYEAGQPVVYCYEIHLKPDLRG